MTKLQGQQTDLKPVSLRGMVEIDPTRVDFFKAVIEARARVRKDSHLSAAERDALAYFLKILANAGSYGLFVEVNPAKLGSDAKTGKPARTKLHVYSGEQVFEQTSPMIEELGRWYFPLFAALITAGGRLESRGSGPKQHRQNCGADDCNAFHKFASLSA